MAGFIFSQKCLLFDGESNTIENVWQFELKIPQIQIENAQ